MRLSLGLFAFVSLAASMAAYPASAATNYYFSIQSGAGPITSGSGTSASALTTFLDGSFSLPGFQTPSPSTASIVEELIRPIDGDPSNLLTASLARLTRDATPGRVSLTLRYSVTDVVDPFASSTPNLGKSMGSNGFFTLAPAAGDSMTIRTFVDAGNQPMATTLQTGDIIYISDGLTDFGGVNQPFVDVPTFDAPFSITQEITFTLSPSVVLDASVGAYAFQFAIVPEPASAVFLGVASAAVLLRRRRNI